MLVVFFKEGEGGGVHVSFTFSGQLWHKMMAFFIYSYSLEPVLSGRLV